MTNLSDKNQQIGIDIKFETYYRITNYHIINNVVECINLGMTRWESGFILDSNFWYVHKPMRDKILTYE